MNSLKPVIDKVDGCHHNENMLTLVAGAILYAAVQSSRMGT
jgi:hypothetical protein